MNKGEKKEIFGDNNNNSLLYTKSDIFCFFPEFLLNWSATMKKNNKKNTLIFHCEILFCVVCLRECATVYHYHWLLTVLFGLDIFFVVELYIIIIRNNLTRRKIIITSKESRQRVTPPPVRVFIFSLPCITFHLRLLCAKYSVQLILFFGFFLPDSGKVRPLFTFFFLSLFFGTTF